MYQFVFLVLLGAPSALGVRQLEPREGKSLVNTFPFNANVQGRSAPSRTLDARDQHQHQHHHHHHVNNDQLATVKPGKDGKRCIDKVVHENVTEYDDEITCNHSYDKICHTTYITNYESQQEEECEENFRKNCFIDYEQFAFNETVEICRTHLDKNCKEKGPEICRTEYESECWTTYEVHNVTDDVVSCETVNEKICEPVTSGYTTEIKCSEWPREVCTITPTFVPKYTPVTGCDKIPITICAPAGCKVEPGEPHCYNKTQTVVQDKPKEECSLEPQRTCKHVTKLVPKLEPTEECVDVPKEVCSRSRINPRPVTRPVIKKWCYVPSEESGLA